MKLGGDAPNFVLFPAHILNGHRQDRRNDFIDLGLDGLHLVVSRAFEPVHHRAVQDMLRRMAWLF